MTTSAADTPLTWPQLAALDWARSGGFTLDIDGEPLREREQIKSAATERVRDIREAPDGSIWFLSVGQGTLYRMTPAN